MKQIMLLRSADAFESPATTEPVTPKKTATARLSTDIDLGSVADKVNQAWTANPNITLVWMTQAEFGNNVNSFNKTLTNRNTIASNRPSLTQGINTINTQIDEAVVEVKIYIAKKYKKAGAVAQYPRFGILKNGSGYRFPANQESRLASIKLMANSIVADGMGEEEYGKDFWEAILVNYEKAIIDASGTDQKVSSSVSSKNVLRGQIKKALSSLRLVLRGNYPDTYTSVYRTWGWMKEKY